MSNDIFIIEIDIQEIKEKIPSPHVTLDVGRMVETNFSWYS